MHCAQTSFKQGYADYKLSHARIQGGGPGKKSHNNSSLRQGFALACGVPACRIDNLCVLSGDDVRWLGEQAVTYSNWEDGSSLSDLAPMDTCVTLHTNTRKWEKVSCEEDLENGVVCEAPESK